MTELLHIHVFIFLESHLAVSMSALNLVSLGRKIVV